MRWPCLSNLAPRFRVRVSGSGISAKVYLGWELLESLEGLLEYRGGAGARVPRRGVELPVEVVGRSSTSELGVMVPRIRGCST